MESNDIINKEINNNYESERNAKTLGPYLNEVEEIKNYNTVGNVINGNQNDYEYNLQTSQKDMEITISDKDNPFFIVSKIQSNILPSDDYDWWLAGYIFGGTFIIIFLLAMLFSRKKKA